MKQQVLEAKVAELTEGLETMARERDQWVLKAHQLQAKLKRYEAQNDALMDQGLSEPDDRGNGLGAQDDGGWGKPL